MWHSTTFGSADVTHVMQHKCRHFVFGLVITSGMSGSTAMLLQYMIACIPPYLWLPKTDRLIAVNHVIQVLP